MKRAVIFLHGNRPDKKDLKKFVRSSDSIICADGGAEYALDAGLTPGIVLGDFDSLPQKFLKILKDLNTPTEKFPTDKDATDSELAVSFAIKSGFKNIILFGVLGDRIDHQEANITYLAHISQERSIEIQIIDKSQILSFATYEHSLKGKIGDTVSLIPLSGEVKGVTTQGLKWELYKDTLEFGATRGVSNVFIKSKAHISVQKGILLVVQQR